MLLSQHAEQGGAACKRHVEAGDLYGALVMHSMHAHVIGRLKVQRMPLQRRGC